MERPPALRGLTRNGMFRVGKSVRTDGQAVYGKMTANTPKGTLPGPDWVSLTSSRKRPRLYVFIDKTSDIS